MIHLLASKIKRLIRIAKIVKAGDDTGNFPVQRISYYGKNIGCNILFPYGMHANLPVGSFVTAYSIGGDTENKVGFGGLPQERIKELPEGEVVFFHPITKSKIHFRNNGDIDIESTENGLINITCKNATIEAEENVEVTSVNTKVESEIVEVNASNIVDIIAPNTIIKGNLIVNGDAVFTGDSLFGSIGIVDNLTVTGDTELASVTSNGKDISDLHTHHYAWTAGSGDDDTDGVN